MKRTLAFLAVLLLPSLAFAQGTVTLKSVAVADPGRELDEKLLETTIGDILSSIRGCYEKRVQKVGAPITGEVLAMMIFDKKGATKAVHVGGIGDAGVEKCVLTALKKVSVMAKLGKRGGVATIRLGFEFEMLGGGAGTGDDKTPAAGPTVDVGEEIAVGEIDKSVIRRKVRQNINKIKFCYEKELRADPKLEARVSVTFAIAADGAVSSAQASGSSSATLHACIESVFKALSFPKPPGGGIVKVTYPFAFKPAP